MRVDVRDFADAAADGRLEEALAIGAAGELLPELDHEWVYEAREEHELRLAEVIERLALDAEQRGDPGAAVEYTRRLVALDPLSEEHARSLMRRLALGRGPGGRARRLRAAPRAPAQRSAHGAVGGHAGARRRDPRRRRGDGADAAPTRAARSPGRSPWRRVPARSSGARTSSPSSRRRGRRSRTASHACAWSPARPGSARAASSPSWHSRSRPPAHLCSTAPVTRAPGLRTGRSSTRSRSTCAGSTRDAAGRRLGTSAGELSRIIPDLRDRFGAAAHVSGESSGGRADAAVRRRRRLPPARRAAARARRDRGHPLGRFGHARAARAHRPDRRRIDPAGGHAAGTSPRT